MNCDSYRCHEMQRGAIKRIRHLQGLCQLSLRWRRPKIFVFQLAATVVNDCWETEGGQKNPTL